MRYFASKHDRRLWETVEQWKAVALDSFRAVETHQEAPGIYFEHPEWWAFEREAILELFMSNTADLTREAKALTLDPRPLQEVFNLVNAWDPGRDAGRGYGRGHLQVALRSALLVLSVIEEEIHSRMVKLRPEPGTQPITPVAVNGREHTSNGAQPVVPTAASPETPKDARDRFLYERLLRGDTQRKALADCNALAVERKWKRIKNTNSAVDAANSWALAHGKPQLPKRKPGRRGGAQY
jgi:hypothetical protein